MKYLFFDLEYATSKGGNIKICEFGFVITDENFKILDRDNFIIFPEYNDDENSIQIPFSIAIYKNKLMEAINQYAQMKDII